MASDSQGRTYVQRQSNGILERWHRAVKAALMCNVPKPWPELLPTDMLGLRTCIKEDLTASPAQLLYGTELRIPGEFFVSEDLPANPKFFLEKFREHIRKVRPSPTAHHITSRCFFLKDLYTSTHVFVRIDAVRKPLELPYSGPHRVVRRIDDRNFVIDLNGTEKSISVDRLKPAYVAKESASPPASPEEPSSPAAPEKPSRPASPPPVPDSCPSNTMDRPLRTYPARKRISFPSSVPDQVTGEGVDVAPLPPSASTSPRDLIIRP
ncbi:uncharacterized protein LOC107042455 [Diachasma alloeum]|uniref:uncharacterized protein LOC107042455 n=1 Tax=Diachasma alloeum TaxID=454923 RepID=UPI0007384D16|nr:uncharacterized protein LOC107042455 [Diachasma alloeum]